LEDYYEINYRAIVKAIKSTGYRLYVGHEFISKGDVFSALKQAYAVMDV
jgi:hydroxypyruvate isomerase